MTSKPDGETPADDETRPEAAAPPPHEAHRARGRFVVRHGRVPQSPAGLDRRAWVGVLRRAVREYRADNLSDWAAALTYRAMLSLFPGLLVLVAVIGLLGDSARETLLGKVNKHVPSGAQGTVQRIFDNAQQQHSAASVIGVIALIVALWSASGYVAAFMRASNAIYDIGEGRPIWKTAPIRLGVTIFLVVAVLIAAAIALLSKGIAHDVGNAIGLGPTAVAVWGVAKWPLLVVVASLTLALLYWAAPNARQPGFSWISPGGLLAVLIWAAASAGFAVYAMHFGSYDKTYGSLAGIVIFLIWLWITNMALLLGAEFNSELQRARAIDAGVPEDHEPYVDLRDTRKLDEVDRERAEALSRHLEDR